MNRIILKGILKKNTKGRRYLVYDDDSGRQRIIRLVGPVDFSGGQTVTVTGCIKGNRLEAETIIPFFYPRRARGKAA